MTVQSTQRSSRGRAGGAVALALAALLALSTALTTSDAAPTAAGKKKKFALATCFWEGPISTKRPTTRGFDGRYFNFPEESATYWLARFNLPEDARLVLKGRYPHGRYMSLNAYSDGAPTDALSDIDIRPKGKSKNPFRTRARRDLRKRAYKVTVVDQVPPEDDSDRAPNTIYADPGPAAPTAPIEVVYRVYEPDRGLGLTGGVPLPKQKLILGDGSVSKKDAACEQVNDPNREITVQTIPASAWQAARSTPPCDPETNPAYNPPRWERFFNLDYASLAVVSDCTEAGREARLAMDPDVEGGLYSNRDSAYIYAHLSREFGPLLVVRGTLPKFPNTKRGPKRMPRGELRFWSLCSGESRVTTRTPDCLADRQVKKKSGRRYLIVVSRAEDRPDNARKRCGVAWLDWGERGDGAGDRDYALLILRNMLVRPRFKEAIQHVESPGREDEVMADHFPRSRYSGEAAFEGRGCPKRGL